jgi:hypothetical protein
MSRSWENGSLNSTDNGAWMTISAIAFDLLFQLPASFPPSIFELIMFDWFLRWLLWKIEIQSLTVCRFNFLGSWVNIRRQWRFRNSSTACVCNNHGSFWPWQNFSYGCTTLNIRGSKGSWRHNSASGCFCCEHAFRGINHIPWHSW